MIRNDLRDAHTGQPLQPGDFAFGFADVRIIKRWHG
jgi:hypothetical protein